MCAARIYIIFYIFVIIFRDTCGQASIKFFRKDYTYIDETKAFYKIHTIHRTWSDAKQRCALEGAKLYFPEDKTEADAVLEFWNRTQPFYWVYVGISDLMVKGVFETIDGTSVTDVYSNWGPGEPNDAGGIEDCVIIRRDGTLNDDRCDKKYPFICKKTLSSLKWNNACDIPNLDYKYDENLGKCYKFHLAPKNWTDAYMMCSIEQSYLAVINSQAEADHLVKMTELAPKDKPRGKLSLSGVVYLGFHNRNSDGWKTIKGQTIEESGYSNWSPNQPDGGDVERCGSMFYNGGLNDLECKHTCFFICEHDIGLLEETSFDDRLGYS